MSETVQTLCVCSRQKNRMLCWEGCDPCWRPNEMLAAGKPAPGPVAPGGVPALLPRLQLVPLALKDILYEARSSIDCAYFPNRGVVSALTVMEDGRAIEVATIGTRHGRPAAPHRRHDNGQPHDRAGSRRGHADGGGRAAGRGQPATAPCASCWSSTTPPFWPKFRRRWLATACTPSTSAVAAG